MVHGGTHQGRCTLRLVALPAIPCPWSPRAAPAAPALAPPAGTDGLRAASAAVALVCEFAVVQPHELPLPFVAAYFHPAAAVDAAAATAAAAAGGWCSTGVAARPLAPRLMFACRLLKRLHTELAAWLAACAHGLQQHARGAQHAPPGARAAPSPGPAAAHAPPLSSQPPAHPRGLPPTGASAARAKAGAGQPQPQQHAPPGQGPSYALRAAAARHGYLLQADVYAWVDGGHGQARSGEGAMGGSSRQDR